MNARRKLNAGYLQGSFVIAGLLGLVTSSAVVFALALAVLLITNLMAGDIRPWHRDR